MARKRVREGRRRGPPAALDANGQGLFEALRAWRSTTAREHGVPAYVIFHDATLAEIAARCPGSLAELQRVSGVGARKLENFGTALLAVCHQHATAMPV